MVEAKLVGHVAAVERGRDLPAGRLARIALPRLGADRVVGVVQRHLDKVPAGAQGHRRDGLADAVAAQGELLGEAATELEGGPPFHCIGLHRQSRIVATLRARRYLDQGPNGDRPRSADRMPHRAIGATVGSHCEVEIAPIGRAARFVAAMGVHVEPVGLHLGAVIVRPRLTPALHRDAGVLGGKGSVLPDPVGHEVMVVDPVCAGVAVRALAVHVLGGHPMAQVSHVVAHAVAPLMQPGLAVLALAVPAVPFVDLAVGRAIGIRTGADGQPERRARNTARTPVDENRIVAARGRVGIDVTGNVRRSDPVVLATHISDVADRIGDKDNIAEHNALAIRQLIGQRDVLVERPNAVVQVCGVHAAGVVLGYAALRVVRVGIRVNHQQGSPHRRAAVLRGVGRVGVGRVGITAVAAAVPGADTVVPQCVGHEPGVGIGGDVCSDGADLGPTGRSIRRAFDLEAAFVAAVVSPRQRDLRLRSGSRDQPRRRGRRGGQGPTAHGAEQAGGQQHRGRAATRDRTVRVR